MSDIFFQPENFSEEYTGAGSDDVEAAPGDGNYIVVEQINVQVQVAEAGKFLTFAEDAGAKKLPVVSLATVGTHSFPFGFQPHGFRLTANKKLTVASDAAAGGKVSFQVQYRVVKNAV